MAREKFVQIENKNALLELLEEGREIEKIYLASNAFKDPKTKRIVAIANERKIPIERASRRALKRRSRTSSAESVIGFMPVEMQYDLKELVNEIFERGEEPFFLIFGNIKYAQNIGAIFRTAFAAGVNGVITPVKKANLLSDEVVRISMGTCLRIPIVETNLFSAVKELQDNGVKIAALTMEGSNIYKSDLKGSIAILLGSEDTGVTSKMLERVDTKFSIPMQEGLGSLNVGSAAAIVMYEKVRQDTSG